MLIWRRDGRCSVVIGICGRTHFQLWLTVKIRFPFIVFSVLSHFPLQMAPSPPGYSGSAGSSGYAGQKWLGARFHGMEEVIGSIPIRSTNHFKHLAPPPSRDFVATLSQIPKPHHEPASQALRRPQRQC